MSEVAWQVKTSVYLLLDVCVERQTEKQMGSVRRLSRLWAKDIYTLAHLFMTISSNDYFLKVKRYCHSSTRQPNHERQLAMFRSDYS